MAEFEFDFSEEAALTNAELAGEMARLSPLTEAEIKKLLPRKVDKQRFAELLKIVNSATSQNNKIAALATNIGDLGGVVVRILTKYLKPV